MKSEITESGFEVEKAIAVEGCIWFTPHLQEKWEDDASRERLLDIVRMTETEPEMMGKLRMLCLEHRRQIRDVIEEALQEYLTKFESEHGTIRVPSTYRDK